MMPAADTILRGKLSKILARLWFLWAKCYRQHWLATNKTPLPIKTLMPRQKRRGMNGLPGKGAPQPRQLGTIRATWCAEVFCGGEKWMRWRKHAGPTMITMAERRFPVRIRIAIPPGGLGQRHTDITACLDQN